MSRIPLLEIPKEIGNQISALGGEPLNLYRALANNPKLLSAWVEFAYALRAGNTPRKLREIMILRTAQMNHSEYEWAQHLKMGQKVGVTLEQIESLGYWWDSNAFDPIERAALAFTEAIVHNHMTDEVYQALASHFSPEDMTELLLTASFYCMVPRFLNAASITTEGE
jgi:alkylhydroperoxidase family enzyme